MDYEGELVAVIGRLCRGVSPEEALTYVFGYTCGNDVSARHWQRDDLQWWRAKGSDTFSPVGPYIATGLDPAALELRTRLNGREVQAANTGTLIHGVAALVSFASQVMTLEPGDLRVHGDARRDRPPERGRRRGGGDRRHRRAAERGEGGGGLEGGVTRTRCVRTGPAA